MKAVTGSDYVGGTSLSTQQRANDGMGALLQFLMMALPEAAPELELCEGGNCFKAGTQVRMKDGSTKSIQKLKVGEIVRSRDPKTGVDVDEPIVRLFVLKTAQILTLQLTNGERFTCTPEHRFFVYKHGILDAGKLKVGDRLIEGDGRTAVTSDKVSIAAIHWGTKATNPAAEATVYNIEVAVTHVFRWNTRPRCLGT